jgi:hypothetical protein
MFAGGVAWATPGPLTPPAAERVGARATDLGGSQDATERGRSVRHVMTLTAGVGGIHAVLFLLTYWLVSDLPGVNATDAQITAFYESDQRWRIVLAGLYVGPFAGMAFIWFLVALRMWVDTSARRVSLLLSNIQLVAGIIYVALFFAGLAASSVLAASAEFADAKIDPDTARQFPQYGDTLLFVFSFRMAAMFVFTTSAIGRASGILPRPFVWSGYAVGLFLLLSAGFEGWFALVFPLWLLALTGILFIRARRIPPELRLPAHAPSLIPEHQAPGK